MAGSGDGAAGYTRDMAVCVSGAPRHIGRRLPRKFKFWPPGVRGILVTMPEPLQHNLIRSLSNAQWNWTIADTVHQFLFPSLGRFDVFMYVPLVGGQDSRVQAEAACQPLVPRDSAARLFCAGGPDRDLAAADLGVSHQRFQRLDAICWHPFARLLQQLRGHALCSTMIREQEALEGTHYAGVVRLRADSVFLGPVPRLAGLHRDKRTVFIRSFRDGCCGNEDIFNVGAASIMQPFLERLRDLWRENFTESFNAEDFARFWVSKVYKGRMRPLRGLYTHPWKRRPQVDSQLGWLRNHWHSGGEQTTAR